MLSREIAELKEAGVRDQLEKQRLQEKIRELTEVIQTQQAIHRQELAGKGESLSRVEQELETKEKAILDLQKQLADTKRNVSKLEGTIANMQQQQQNSGASNAKEMVGSHDFYRKLSGTEEPPSSRSNMKVL